MAEADGNRTRQGPNRPLTGFEDRGTHQASRRLPVRGLRLEPNPTNRPDDQAQSFTTIELMPERSFGRTIRYRRTKLGISQAKLGDLVGRSAGTIRSWERDQSTPNDSAVLTTLAAVLGIEERILYDKTGVEMPERETSPTVEEALASLAPETVSAEVVDEPMLPPAEEDAPSSAALPPPAYVSPPESYVIAAPSPPLVEPSYIEDSSQRQMYRVRHLATLVMLVGLVIVLLWALSNAFSAFGLWWDDFFGKLRI